MVKTKFGRFFARVIRTKDYFKMAKLMIEEDVRSLIKFE